MKENAAKMVSLALMGADGQKIILNGVSYVIKPPTIKQIVGAGVYLSDFGNETTAGDLIKEFEKFEGLCKALSWFINAKEEGYEEFELCTLDEILYGLETSFNLIDIKNFARLSTLARNVKMAIAKQR